MKARAAGIRKDKNAQLHYFDRCGWTLLEVLLTVVTILVIVTIAMPFVKSAVEVSRRNHCKANTARIGVALSQYHDLNGRFPSGFVVDENGPYLGWGWNQRILPHLDLAELSKSMEANYARGMKGLIDTPDHAKYIASLRCPSDLGQNRVKSVHVITSNLANWVVPPDYQTTTMELPRSNYFGNAGYRHWKSGGIQYNSAGIATSVSPLTNEGSIGPHPVSDDPATRYCDHGIFGGYFGHNSQISYLHVVDGTSNTIMHGERYSPHPGEKHVTGDGTWIGVPDFTRVEGLAMVLGDASVRINLGMPNQEATTGFGSFHSGGAMFGLGDGSVRFISQNIDIEIYRNLCLINDSSR